MLGLFAMAAAALMAFAGSASAQTLTAPTGHLYTGPVKTSLESSASLKAGFAEITCTSGEFNFNITTNNSTEASGEITGVSFSGCQEGQTVDTLNNKGTLKIANGTHTVTATGVEVTTAVAGVSCVYGFGTGTELGKWTNTLFATSGKIEDRVTIDTSAKVPKTSGGFLCANPATWEKKEVITSPADSYVH
jgi:hypothetical protein